MRPWTMPEIKYLRENRDKPFDQLAKELGRSRRAVVYARSLAGITCSPGWKAKRIREKNNVIDPDVKRCSSCWQNKPLSEYYSDKTNVDGKRCQCKKCHYKSQWRSRARKKSIKQTA